MADKIAHRGPDDSGYLCFHTGTKNKDQSYYQNLTDSKYLNKDSKLSKIDSDHVQRLLHNYEFDLYMGHRRLSILDVSYAGHQPMSDLSQNIWITLMEKFVHEIKNELEKHRIKEIQILQ